MSFPERRTTDVLLTIAFFVLGCAIIYSARRILLIFVFAVFFPYLINPIAKFIQIHSLFFRNLVVEVYLALVLLTAGVGYAFAPKIALSTAKLADEVPAVLDGLASGEIATQLAGEFGWSEATEFRFKTFLVGVYLAIPLMASVRVIWQMSAAKDPRAAESRRPPAATTTLLTSSSPGRVAYVEAIPTHAKAD